MGGSSRTRFHPLAACRMVSIGLAASAVVPCTTFPPIDGYPEISVESVCTPNLHNPEYSVEGIIATVPILGRSQHQISLAE